MPFLPLLSVCGSVVGKMVGSLCTEDVLCCVARVVLCMHAG